MRTKTLKQEGKSATKIWQQAISIYSISCELGNRSRANKALNIARRYYNNIRRAAPDLNPDKEKDCNRAFPASVYAKQV